jgi:hypothetical protein
MILSFLVSLHVDVAGVVLIFAEDKMALDALAKFW